MRKLIGMFLVVITMLAITSSAWAYALPIDFKMKIANLEVFNPAIVPGVGPFGDGIEDNWGIANVTSIFDANQPLQPAVWNEGNSGEHLRIMFWGLDVTSWSGADGTFTTGPAFASVPYAGADLWLWDSDLAGYSAFSPLAANRTAFNAFTSVSGSNAGLQASLAFAPGIDFAGSLTKGATSLIANPPVGHGAGYFDVLPGGAIGSFIDTNTFATPFGNRDIFLEFDFSIPGSGGFQLSSDDPVLGHAVPEPSSMMLLGMGIAGLASALRKRKVA